MAYLASVAAVDGDRAGCYDPDHADRVGDGFGVQFDPAFCVFFVRPIVNPDVCSGAKFFL